MVCEDAKYVRLQTALMSCINTTFVASPCHPLSPLAANKKLQVGSTTDRQLLESRFDLLMLDIVPP